MTSAMKGLAETVKHMLGEVVAGNFANYGGQIETLGLVNGDDPTANYVQLPMETTQWGDGFTQDDYKALVKAMYDGDVTVSNDISAMPADHHHGELRRQHQVKIRVFAGRGREQSRPLFLPLDKFYKTNLIFLHFFFEIFRKI